MKWLTKCAFLYALLYALWGCCPYKDLPKQSTSKQKDSTRTEIRWREFHIHDTVPFYIPIERHSVVTEDSSHLETGCAISDAFIDGTGRLHHTLENKAQWVNIPVENSVLVSDTNHYENHAKVDSIYVPQPYPVKVEKPLTGWQKFQMRGFWALLIAGILFIAWKTRKIWMKFLK